MSYCVNCGVELEQSLHTCPLCNTPVINPNEPDKDKTAAPSPYASERGIVDPVNKTDTAILITVVLLSTAIACGLVNLFLLNNSLWSVYIIGICVLLWIFISPVFSPRQFSAFIVLFFDGIGVALYCGMIAWRQPGDGWYLGLALPIIALTTALLCAFAFFMKHFRSSILSAAIVIFIEIPILCIGIELLIRNYMDQPLHINWSAIVLACCAVIVIVLTTVIRRNRLREAMRRRLHI